MSPRLPSAPVCFVEARPRLPCSGTWPSWGSRIGWGAGDRNPSSSCLEEGGRQEDNLLTRRSGNAGSRLHWGWGFRSVPRYRLASIPVRRPQDGPASARSAHRGRPAVRARSRSGRTFPRHPLGGPERLASRRLTYRLQAHFTKHAHKRPCDRALDPPRSGGQSTTSPLTKGPS